MIGFHTVLDCCGLGFEPETEVSKLVACFVKELWYGCMKPNWFMFVKGP